MQTVSQDLRQEVLLGAMLIPKGPCRYMVYTYGPRGSHIPTVRPWYIPYSYIDPLGMCACAHMYMKQPVGML